VNYDAPVEIHDRARFRDFVRQRSTGKPIAYIVGTQEFYSLPFRVSPATLIPRPETETLVREALDRIDIDRPCCLADLGTGSGAIALTILRHRPLARATAIDIDADALDVARMNADLLDVADRATFLQSDLFDQVEPSQTFDLIVSNPPYVRSSEWAELDKSVRDFEPRRALEAGPDGLDIFRRIFDDLAHRLVPGGWFLAEFGIEHDEPLYDLARRVGVFQDFSIVQDDARRPRVIAVRQRFDEQSPSA
jgi:release factor glutamine methyltransferase